MGNVNTKDKTNSEKDRLQLYSGAIILFITIGNLLAGIFNFGVASKLEPIAGDIRLINMRADALETSMETKVDGKEFGVFSNLLIDKVNKLEAKIDLCLYR